MTSPARKLLTLWSVGIFLTAFVSLLYSLSAQRPSRRNLPPGSSVRTASGAEVKLYDASYALVIGASDYTNGWRRLPGVKNDVETVKTALKQHGFVVDVVMNPTRVELEEAIRKFIGEHGQEPGNRLVVYFAGHGWTIKASGGQLGYIVPSDAPTPDKGEGAFMQHAIQFMHVQGYAMDIQSKHALFLFDSCFSGALLEANRSFSAPPMITDLIAKDVRQYITSGTADQEVRDDSIFCRQFVEGLKGEADNNKDGYVTGSELGMFLEKQVTYYSKGKQTPQWGKILNEFLDKGDVVFASPKAQRSPTPEIIPITPTGEAEELRQWIKATETNDYKAYLDKYPNGEHADEASSRIAKSYFERAATLVEDEQNDEAETILWAGLRLQPASARGHVAMGKLLFRRRRLTEARRELKQALQSEPDNIEAHYLLGAALKEQRQLDAAKPELDTAMRLVTAALALEHNSSELHGLKSGILHYQPNYPGEESEALRALELDAPGNTRWYERLGAALIAQRKWTEAERAYRKALALKPDSGRWHSNLGYVLGELGRFAEAEPLLREALRLDPKRGQSYINLGVILSKQKNRWPEAEAAYLQGVKLDPENAGLLHHFAYELSERRRYREAERYYRLAAQFDSKNAGQHADLGKNLFRQEKYFEAEIAYSDAVRLDSQNSEYRDQLRRVRERTQAAK